MNKASLCVFLGVSRPVVDRLIAEGLPAKEGSSTRPVFDASQVAKWLVQRAEYSGKRRSDNVVDFTDQRERLAAAQADKAEIQAAILRGELVRADAAEQAWSAGVTAARDLFRMIPMSAVDRVLAAAEDGRAAVKAVLEDEVDDVLRRVAAMEIVIEPEDDAGEEAAA